MEIWHEDSITPGRKGPEVEMRIPIVKAEEFGEAMAEWGQQFGESIKK